MYRCALPEGPVRSASRGSPAASSIRLALRTSSIVATRRASFVRWVLRCFGRRSLSSSPKLPPISVMPSIIRFQVPPRADSLNHTPTRHVNNLLLKLIDGKIRRSFSRRNDELDFAQIRWGFVSAWECSRGEACRVEQAVGERSGYFYHVPALA